VCDVVSQTLFDAAVPQSLSVAQPHVSFARQTGPFEEPMQLRFAAHSTQWFVASQNCPPEQSGSLRHCTHWCGCAIVSQTEFGDAQSELWSHGWDMHVPTEPSVFVQYLPVVQFVVPATTRHPGVHLPVATVDVSQYESSLQSASLLHPQVAAAIWQNGVSVLPTQALEFNVEHWPHWPASGVPASWQAGSAAVPHADGPGLAAE
jgi:hypothetical protein